MAKKFEIVGQALVITDESIPKVLFDAPKGEVYYDSDLLINEGIIKINNIDALDNVSKSAPKVLLIDAVDSGDTAFTESGFISFARTNLGFKTASGGSGAVDSVNTQTGVVVLDADDISDTSTTKKFTTSTEKATWDSKQGAITLTTTGTSGSATLVGDTLNIPQYTGGGATVSDAVYDGTWNGDTEGASKNALYDKIESVIAGVGTNATPQSFTAVGGETTWVVTGAITSSHKFFVNGVKLVEAADYTKTGSTFTFIPTTGYTSVAGHLWEYFPDIAVPSSTTLDTTNNSIIGDSQTATGDGTTTIDWGAGNTFDFQFGAFNEVFTFTAPTKAGTFILKLVQDSVGSRTVTFPATVKWSGGTAPTLTTTATTGTDIITFYFDGTNYFAVEALNFS